MPDIQAMSDREFLRYSSEMLAKMNAEEDRRRQQRAADEERKEQERLRREAARALIYDPVAARRKYALRTPHKGKNDKLQSDGHVRRAIDEIKLKAWFAHDKPRLIEGVATTSKKTSHGNYKNMLGVTFDLPIPLLKSHDADYPLGYVYDVTVTHDRITFKAQLDNGCLDHSDDVWRQIVSGDLLGVSVSPSETDAFVRSDVGQDKSALILDSWRWRELSVCRIGANESARILRVMEGDRTIIDLRDSHR